MTESAATESAATCESPWARADVAVVFVHGIGRQMRDDTLLSFAEPMVVWLRDRVGGAGHVEVDRAMLVNGDTPAHAMVSVSPNGEEKTRWCLAEAHWADSFPPPTPAAMFGWAGRFSWRASRRIIAHVLRPVDIAWSRFVYGTGAAKKVMLDEEDQPASAVDGMALFVGALWVAAAVVMLLTYLWVPVAVYVACIILSGILLVGAVYVFAALMAVAVKIPFVSGKVSGLATALVTSVGDTYALLDRPIRAAAMTATIVKDLVWAHEQAHKVVVVAHSQGAALMARILSGDRHHVDELLTVGGAVALLQEASPAPVQSILGGTHPLVWTNLWSTWDPVSAGPVHDPGQNAGDRWRELYGVTVPPAPVLDADPSHVAATAEIDAPDPAPEAAPVKGEPVAGVQQLAGAVSGGIGEAYKQMGLVVVKWLPDAGEQQLTLVPGPAEVAVHNQGSPIRDHTTYTGNDLQVIRRIVDVAAKHVGYGEDWSANGDVAQMRRMERRHVTAVRLLAASRLVCALAAVAAVTLIARAKLDDSMFQVLRDAMAHVGVDLAQWRARAPTPAFADAVWLSLIGIVVYLVLTAAISGTWSIWYRTHLRSAVFAPRSAWGWRCLMLGTPLLVAVALVGWGAYGVLVQIEDPDAQPLAWAAAAFAASLLLWSLVGFRPNPIPERRPNT